MALTAELANTRSITLALNGGVVTPVVGVGPQGLPGAGAPAWVALETVTTGLVRQAPDGSFIKATTNRTTRATFDSTEQGFWTATLATAGTIENSALLASYVQIAHRPINLAERLPAGHATSDPADTYLAAAISEGAVVEWPASLPLTLTDAAGITVPAGHTLRGGPSALALVNHAGDGFKVSGVLEDLEVQYTGGSSIDDAAVHAMPTSQDVRLRRVKVTGSNACFALGGNEHTGGTASDVIAEECEAFTAVTSSYCYRIDESLSTTLRDCIGTGAKLDIIKLRRKAKRFRLEGGRFTGSVGGDGLDGFAGAEQAFIGAGVVFHDNGQNGFVFKTDDLPPEAIAAQIAEWGLPQRLIVDGVTAINNGGSGGSLHRSDGTDSDVAGGALIPWLRAVVVSNLMAGDNDKGLFLNLRGAHLQGIIAARSHNRGIEVHANARDITMNGVHAFASGTGGDGTLDNFYLAGKRIWLAQCMAYGVDPDAVADANLAAATPVSRYGYRVPTGAQVRLVQCGAYYNATAPLSDSDGLTTQIDCDFAGNPSGAVLTTGQVVAIHDGAARRTMIALSAAGIGNIGNFQLDELVLTAKTAGFVTATTQLRPQASNSYGLGSASARWSDLWLGGAVNFLGGPTVLAGTGSPEGVVFGYPGSIFIRSDGAVGTLFYQKQGVGNTKTGWVALSRLATTGSADDLADGTTNKTYTATEKTKLAGINPGQVDVYTANGTWTKPSWATSVRVLVIGPGGAGASGAVTASGTPSSGGAGGGGGAKATGLLHASDLPATVGVVVPALATGGASKTSTGSGNAGGSAAVASFGSYVAARGGGGGAGGVASAASTGGTLATGEISSSAGGGGVSGAAGATSNGSGAATGGGAGGGVSAAPAAFAGGASGSPTSASNTGITTVGASGGGAGTDGPVTLPGVAGAGASGGGSSIAGDGGAGGAGLGYGAGGGGGGSALAGSNSGAGGNGGPGIVIVISTP